MRRRVPSSSLTTLVTAAPAEASAMGVMLPRNPATVWMARDDEDLVFISDDDTGKTKRLRRDPRVELRPCSIRGVVAQGAPTHRGTATMRRDDAAIRRVRAAIGRKYPTGRLLNMVTRLGRRAGLVRRTSVAIVIRLGD